jgi:hypothetical protein
MVRRKRVSYHRNATLICLLFVVSAACRPSAERSGTQSGPTLQATVLTVRTTIHPTKEVHTHRIVIAGDRVRSTDEQDVWRLFDLSSNSVTSVDEVAKTVRTESMDDFAGRRRTATADPLPPHYPQPRVIRSDETRPLHGVSAQQLVVESGGYRRELWMAAHPSIPAGLFALMHASEAPSSPLAPMMRAVDEALMSDRGFPLRDRTEVTFGEQRTVIERAVTSIEETSVPVSLFAYGDDFVDLTPQPQDGTRRRR